MKIATFPTGSGADVNLMDEELLGRILQDEADVLVRDLAAPRKLHVGVDTSKDAQPITKLLDLGFLRHSKNESGQLYH